MNEASLKGMRYKELRELALTQYGIGFPHHVKQADVIRDIMAHERTKAARARAAETSARSEAPTPENVLARAMKKIAAVNKPELEKAVFLAGGTVEEGDTKQILHDKLTGLLA